MIPKIIHYCWFGGTPEPKEVKKCIDSWKRYLPDYKIIRWDESNYDVTKNSYMEQAYNEKKWAFVSDYCRLDVVYQHGGIYLDTDVEVVKSFNTLLCLPMFCGFESRDWEILKYWRIEMEESVSFGLGFGAVAHHPILEEILNLYANLQFYNNDGSLNLISCPYYQTLVLKKHGMKQNGECQVIDDCHIFSAEYFSPQSNVTDKMLFLTDKTYSIHHFSSTWNGNAKKNKIRNYLYRYFPFFIADKISSLIMFFK